MSSSSHCEQKLSAINKIERQQKEENTNTDGNSHSNMFGHALDKILISVVIFLGQLEENFPSWEGNYAHNIVCLKHYT